MTPLLKGEVEMSKLCRSFERYWDLEARHKKLNPHVNTIFEEELSNEQSLKVAVAITVVALAIGTFWSIMVML